MYLNEFLSKILIKAIKKLKLLYDRIKSGFQKTKIYTIQKFKKLRLAVILSASIIAFILLTRLLQHIAIKYTNYQLNLDRNLKDISSSKIMLEKEIASLDRKLNSKIPRSYFLIINSTKNEFSLNKGDLLIKKDKCSTGSYILLKNGDDQEWMFKTPKGEFRIQGKTTSPVWKKPDWAFVEEGLPVPPSNHHSRYEYGVLGDYALSLGNGYLIHGTLFQRFLGLPVTHGCIRLNDENLELVYNKLNIGSKVYIF